MRKMKTKHYLLLMMVVTIPTSCTSLKAAIGSGLWIQTLSLEEVIEQSKEIPYEYKNDLYYKELKVATIQVYGLTGAMKTLFEDSKKSTFSEAKNTLTPFIVKFR